MNLKKTFKKGGRVGFQEGGAYDPRASMQDYAAALKNVSGGRTDQQLDDLKAYARNLASQELAAAGKANRGYTGIYDKYFKGRTGLGGQGFNWGRDTETMNTAHSYNLRDRDQILDDMAGQIMMDQQSYEVQKLNQQRIAEREAAKQRAEQERINAAIKAAYGSPEDYEFQAQLLGGMNPQAYYDYLITGNPKGVDMGAGITTDAYSRSINPYNVYFAEELARQKQMGIPSSQQIQYGQVTRPGGIMMDPAQMNTAQMNQGIIPSMYIPYADAVTLQKQEWDRRFPQGSPKYQTYKSTYPAPDQSTWAPFKQSWGQTYNKGGRVGYANGGLNLSDQAQTIYDAWERAGHSQEDILAYLESRGLYNTPVVQQGIMKAPNIINQNLGGDGGDGGGNIITRPSYKYTSKVDAPIGSQLWLDDIGEGTIPKEDITLGTQWNEFKHQLSQIPTPYNLAKKGIVGAKNWFKKQQTKAQKWADDRRIEKEKAEAAEAAIQAAAIQAANRATYGTPEATGGYQSSWGGNQEFMEGPPGRDPFSGDTDLTSTMASFAKGGLATMFTRKR